MKTKVNILKYSTIPQIRQLLTDIEKLQYNKDFTGIYLTSGTLTDFYAQLDEAYKTYLKENQ
jgi:hypothetical protein